MAADNNKPQPPVLPVLQKPPGYRDPNNPTKPAPRPAPPKSVALPRSFKQPRKRSRHCCRTFCCVSFITIIIVVLLLLIFGALFYLWFNPQFPVFHLQSFKLPSFNVTSRPDGTYLNAATVARVEVKNPNQKLAYRYGKSEVEITCGRDGDVPLGSANLDGFRQEQGEARSLKIEASVRNAPVDDGVGSRILAAFRRKELVVNVAVKTSVGLGVWGMNIGMLGVNIVCGDMTLKQLDDGGEMPKCVINTLKWINIH